MFVIFSHFPSSLIFVVKTTSTPLDNSPLGQSLANTRIAWKRLPVTNTLAYYSTELIRAVKRFIALAFGHVFSAIEILNVFIWRNKSENFEWGKNLRRGIFGASIFFRWQLCRSPLFLPALRRLYTAYLYVINRVYSDFNSRLRRLCFLMTI